MSLHIVKSGRSRLVACADSIGYWESGPPVRDVEKLFQTGRFTVCGTAGLTEAGPGDPIAARINALARSVGDSPRQFLAALRDELQPNFLRLFAQDRSRFQWLMADTEVLFVAFCLRRDPSGTIDLLELQFPLFQADGKPALAPPEIIPHVEGVLPGGPVVYNLAPTAFPAEALISLDADAQDQKLLDDIDATIDRIRSDSDVIGAESMPATHVAVIERTGVRWLRQKVRINSAAVGRARA